MLISEPQELRLHVPSNAVDDVDNFQGILNTSEKDFLKDKLGADLYDRLCAYYKTLDPVAFAQSVVDGTYSQNPWSELLFYAQSMIVNDAFTRFAYQQVISVNGSGINVVSGNDYGNADDRLLDKGVSGYRKESMKALNNLLVLLEEWSNQLSTPMPIEDEEVPVPDASASGEEGTEADGDTSPSSAIDAHTAIEEIVTLWQKSKYFYRHADLLLPTCVILNEYLDIEDYRDRFIRLLPDLHFIQNQYITKAIGVEQLQHLLSLCVQEQNGNLDKYSDDGQYLDTVRYLMVAYLEQRTTVLTIDKARRQQAHDEAISLKENILAYLKSKEQPSSDATEASVPDVSPSGKTYQNNAEGSRIFVSPLLY